MSDQQGNQWIYVKTKKKKYIEKDIKPEKVFAKGGRKMLEKDQEEIERERFKQHASFQKNKLLFQQIYDKYTKNIVKNERIHIICLGLGNFSTNLKPYLQFIFLTEVILPHFIQFDLTIYDPIFTQREKELLLKLNCKIQQPKIIKQNTICFMPHCQRFLYERILEIKQKEVIIIGNSIEQYQYISSLTKTQNQPMENHQSRERIKVADYQQSLNDTYFYII